MITVILPTQKVQKVTKTKRQPRRSEKPLSIGIKVYQRERVMLRKIKRVEGISQSEIVRRAIRAWHNRLFTATA